MKWTSKLYAVRDVKADAFGPPMAVTTDGLARRGFLEACSDPRSDLYKYASDYMLFHIGYYDADTATVEPLTPAPKFICSASGILEEQKQARLKIEPELPICEVTPSTQENPNV